MSSVKVNRIENVAGTAGINVEDVAEKTEEYTGSKDIGLTFPDGTKVASIAEIPCDCQESIAGMYRSAVVDYDISAYNFTGLVHVVASGMYDVATPVSVGLLSVSNTQVSFRGYATSAGNINVTLMLMGVS